MKPSRKIKDENVLAKVNFTQVFLSSQLGTKLISPSNV